MKILMIAPEPVFRVRGTPFSVRDRCRALSDLGHTVDLLTYPFGDDFTFPGIRIHRTRRVPGIRDIRIGFSWQKLPLDGLLFLKAIAALRRGGYELIHTHEEAGMMGALLAPLFRIPHVYDMHSSLPQQFENYATSTAKPVMAFMRLVERFILSRSHAVIAICPNLRQIALEARPDAPVFVIENVAQMSDTPPSDAEIESIRRTYDLSGKFVIGYTGTFEVNQGLEILARAFVRFVAEHPEGVLFLAGGEDQQVREMRQRVEALGIADQCRIPGKIEVPLMPAVMGACSVLASPRLIGTNTPLKIYSYLKSGVPILATRLLTHTQVLDDEVAVLTEPTVEGLHAGMKMLHDQPEMRSRLGREAVRREKECYSYPAYLKKVDETVRHAVMTKPEQRV